MSTKVRVKMSSGGGIEFKVIAYTISLSGATIFRDEFNLEAQETAEEDLIDFLTDTFPENTPA